MTIKKVYKKEEDKFSSLFTLNISKPDYDFIKELAKQNKVSIRKLVRKIIQNHYKNSA
jgi:predicted HicB family RNase H-like nuclease